MPDRLRLLGAAEQVLSSAKSSRYQHATYVDEANGVYDFDCSGFVDYVLQETFPNALAAVEYHPNRLNRPYHQDYYRFFAKLRTGDNVAGWHSVARASDLLPGDIIVWLRPNRINYTGTGHVMIVRSSPTVDATRTNEVNIQIIDSTRSPHAFDSRVNGANGVGIGTISIVLNTTGNAVGFRWRDGASTSVEYARIAFGELDSITSATYGISNSSLDQIFLALAAVGACAVVGVIGIAKLRHAKSPRQKPNLRRGSGP
jgi:hypothetical protein